MSIAAKTKQEVIKKHAKSEKDTGSPEVQVAILSERIKTLTEHFKIHTQDTNGKRGLMRMVRTRRGLLDYLKKTSEERYKSLVESLGLRK